ncbi:ribonuclease T(2) [uncultured Thiodictyon sp.]|uniref:ribonuclease T2 family protein n=1 Tax=uncultured Thiodictyon sp. TaxID=1846217 RepID=UPI0025CF9DB5|nr:ribonuclease T(2) [uncultured Thiodictyon sp.]
MHLSRLLIPLALGLWPLALAAEPFAGSLIAERDCPAGISTKHRENPGEIRLMPGERYRIVARNKPQPTHYQLRIESARPKDRWIEVACGRLAAAVAAESQPPPAANPATTATPAKGGGMADQYVLAASWQPAFCETHPRRPECQDQTPDRADARQFSLHGLWPQPIGRAYCGVAPATRAAAQSGDWQRLPAPDLTPATRTALTQVMPGALSDLDRHEWTKHGTCYGTDADTYFRQSIALLAQLNGSAVQQLFASNIGKRLRAEEVRGAFDRAFGPGSGERVRLECDPNGLITELRIGLKGPIADRSALGGLILPAPTRTQGCRGGWVDRAGAGR